MEILVRRSLGMRMQEEPEVLTDHKDVIQLLVHHFKKTHRLQRARIGETEGEAGGLVGARNRRADLQIERILRDIGRALDERHAAARTRAGLHRPHVRIHRAVKAGVGAAVQIMDVTGQCVERRTDARVGCLRRQQAEDRHRQNHGDSKHSLRNSKPRPHACAGRGGCCTVLSSYFLFAGQGAPSCGAVTAARPL